MTKSVPRILHILFLLLMLSSCMNSRLPLERRAAQYVSKTPENECFVQLTDGSIKKYKTLQLVTGVCRAPHLLADGTQKIYPQEIIAYQNRQHYAVAASMFSIGGHRSNIAAETLPGFAVRIATGRLNVYVKKFRVNTKVVDEFYFQQGNGQVLVYTPELMDALIKNEPEALDFFNTNRRKLLLTRELKLTARIYNDAYFREKDDEKLEDKRYLAKSDKRKN